jgi:hypothetical protein
MLWVSAITHGRPRIEAAKYKVAFRLAGYDAERLAEHAETIGSAVKSHLDGLGPFSPEKLFGGRDRGRGAN